MQRRHVPMSSTHRQWRPTISRHRPTDISIQIHRLSSTRCRPPSSPSTAAVAKFIESLRRLQLAPLGRRRDNTSRAAAEDDDIDDDEIKAKCVRSVTGAICTPSGTNDGLLGRQSDAANTINKDLVEPETHVRQSVGRSSPNRTTSDIATCSARERAGTCCCCCCIRPTGGPPARQIEI